MILYRSMFVKLSDGRFIPMVEIGDNNVWEIGNQRRARDWQQWNFGNGKTFPAYTREEIITGVERMIDSEKVHRVGKPYADYERKEGVYTEQEIERNWGYYSGIAIEGRHCNNTSAQQVRNFFLKGFEQAVSFDEDSDLKMELHWCTEYPNYERRKVCSEQELLQTWEECMEEKRSIWLDYYCCANWLYEQHRKRAPKREKKEYQSGYVVTINDRYITKVSSRSFFHCYCVDYAHIYPQRATAEKLQQRIQRASYTSEVHPVRKNENGRWELAA